MGKQQSSFNESLAGRLQAAFVRVANAWGNVVIQGIDTLGDISLFAWRMLNWMIRSKPRRETLMPNFYSVGVLSLPVVALTGTFIGMVLAIQSYHQFKSMGLESKLGAVITMSLVRELGPVLAATMLAGRVGSAMAAVIGTMRVTEQIDALETLSFDPVGFLALPRLLAALVMLPALTVLANATAIFSAWATLVTATDVRTDDFLLGLRLAFTSFQVIYSLIKAFCFGAAISFVCSYQGYVTEAGAEGVGRSTATAVVIASVSILVLDAIVAAVLAPFIQA